MPKVALDTNVLISALTYTGKPKRLIDIALEGKVILLVSKGVVAEFRRVIGRDKFKLSKDVQATLTDFIVRLGVPVEVKSKCRVVKQDPSDNIILNTAYDGRADYIVSGDEHLLGLKEFKGIKIVTTGEMLELLRKK